MAFLNPYWSVVICDVGDLFQNEFGPQMSNHKVSQIKNLLYMYSLKMHLLLHLRKVCCWL